MATQKAQADLFKSSATGLNQNSTGKIALSVLANDTGAPKAIFSLDKGTASTPSSLPSALRTQDTARTESASKDTSLNGAKIWINANGTVGYDAGTLSASFRAELQKLGAGQTLTDSFNYAIRLSDGTLSWATAKVEFAGTNDAAKITASSSDDLAVTEAGGVANGTVGDPKASGKLTVTDVDTGQAVFKAPAAASLKGTYGSFTFNASTGAWTYALDNARAATQALVAGTKVHDTLTVTSADGTATKVIDVTITGSNDAATITASGTPDTTVVEAGGVANATAGDLTASGKLTVTDVEAGQGAFKAPAAASLLGTYGTFTFTASTGAWTYTLDNARAATQGLVAGAVVHDILTVTSTDGTAKAIDVTITGSNDAATISTSGVQDTAVVEAGGVANGTAGDPTASGKLTVTDVDTGQAAFKAPAAASLQGTYGSFAFNASTGVWSYALDNARTATQALAQGAVVHDVLTVTSADGTATRTIDVTVTGSNDAATITTAVSDAATLQAGGGGAASASGKLVVHDVDAGEDHFLAPAAASLEGTYGRFTFDASTGEWTYTLDGARAASQGLASGAAVHETLTVTSADGTAHETIDVTVISSNHAPVAVADSAAVDEGGTVIGSLAANDSDPDAGDAASLGYALDAPVAGLTVNPDGSYSFDANDAAYQHLAAGDSAEVVASYTVTDAHGATGKASLTIAVTGTNDAPVAADDIAALAEGSGTSGSVAANDSDPDDGETGTMSYALDVPVAGLTLNADGSYSFDASGAAYQHLAAGATEKVVASYTVTDAHGATGTASLAITVTGTNDAPVAADDSAAVDEDAVLTGTVAANDTDADDGEVGTLSYALDAPVAGLTLNADGSYSFDAGNAAYQHLSGGATEQVVASHTVTDAHGATGSASLSITVTGTNDAPTAVADAAGVAEDAIVTGSVAGNDSDPDEGETATLGYALDAPVAGLTVNADGSYSFDAGDAAYQHLAAGVTEEVVANYTVTDAHGASGTGSLTITVTGANDAPVAADDSAAVNEDAVLTGTVAVNDTDADDGEAGTLTYALDAAVAGLTLNVDGSYSFDAGDAAYQHLAAGVTEIVAAHYTVTDAHGATSSASLSITVTGANDAPTAAANSAAVTEDQSIAGLLVSNDGDTGATLSYALGAPVAGLTLNPDGSYSFDAGDAAYQHLAAGATQDVVAGYTVTDAQGATGTGSLTITVTGTNDAPVAADDSAAVDEDAALTGSVAGNDADVDDGAALSYALDAPVAGLTVNPDGTYSFDAGDAAYQHLAAGAIQEVVASYTVTDAQGAAATASLTVTVTGTNDAPVAVDDVDAVAEDAVVTGSVAGNDGDPDDGEGVTLSYALNAPVAGLTLNPDGSYSFDAGDAAYQHLAAGDSELVVASYTVTDAHGATSTASLNITVAGVNDAPTAIAHTAMVDEDAIITGSVAGGDTDADDGEATTLSYALDTPVAGLTLDPDGTYSFDAGDAAYQHLTAGATGLVVAHYTVTDAQGASSTASLTIAVTGTNDAPVAVVDAVAVDEGGIITGSLAGTDADLGDTLSYALDAPIAGLTLNGDGSYSFDAADAAYQHLTAGDTDFVIATYTVRDAQGATDTGSLSITIAGANGAPTAMPDTATVEAGDSVDGSVATNDGDPDDDAATLSYALETPVTGLALNADGSFSFGADEDVYRHLGAGATEQVVASYIVTDAHGASSTASLTITIEGINDTPVAVDDEALVAEDAVVTGSVAANDADADDGEAATLSYSLDAPIAGLTLNADGSWSFDAADAAYQHLAAGDTEVVFATYTVTDVHGASSGAALSITVTGTNDGPAAVSDGAAVAEDAFVTGSVATNDTDPDDGEHATLGYLLGAPVAGLTLNADGSYSFDAGNAAYQHLAAGATETVVANYTVTDPNGATGTASLTITVTGTNDAPTAGADSAAVAEDAIVTGSVAINDGDVDDGEALTLSYALVAPIAGLTLNPDGSYSFDAANAAYQHLAVGATQLVVAGYTVTDAHGATAAASLSITVTGTNDGPVAMADSAAALEDAVVTGTLAANDLEPDDGEHATLGYTLDAPVAGLTLNPDGSYRFDGTNAAYQQLAAGDSQVVVAGYTVTDAHGATSHAALSITVAGTNDAPIATIAPSAYAATEQVVLNLKGTGLSVADIDAGTTSVTVTLSVSEGTLNVGAGTTGALVSGSGTSSVTLTGTLTQINALLATDGASTVSYIDNNDAPSAAATLTLTINDNAKNGAALLGTDTATISIAAVNDAPVATITPTTYAATEQVSLNLKNNGLSVSDVDAGSGSVSVTLSVGEGALNVTSGTSGALVTGSGSSTVTITGSLAQINALLNSNATSTVSYIDNTDTPSASTTLTLAINDNGGTGTGGALTAHDTATINIAAVNDGPTAVADNVITNVGTGTNFTIPEWALLNNDIDPDGGSTPDISGVSNPSGLTASHSAGTGTNGTVTVNDTTPGGGSFSYSATDGTTVGPLGTVTVSQDTSGTLDGTTGNDILVGANVGTTLVGGDGNDILLGGSSSDTYRFDLSDGTDILRDGGGGTDSISITTTASNTSVAILNFERLGTDLIIDAGATHITLKDHYASGGANTVESISFSNGGTVYGYTLGTGSYSLSTDASGTLSGTANRDVIASSSSGETLSGNNGNDLLFGNAGNDTIDGGSGVQSGDDLIVGGLGNDTLTGGGGNDVFVFNTALSATTNADTITDFDATSNDKISLDHLIFAGVSSSGTLASQDFAAVSNGTTGVVGSSVNVIFDTTSKALYYDADGGDASSGRVLFATLSGVTASTVDNTDFLTF
ncbi:MAG: VCBS domain-containing protein [Amaricoccus sp.]